jgi:hypothetical protein
MLTVALSALNMSFLDDFKPTSSQGLSSRYA